MNPLMHRLGPAFLVVALAFATGACSSDGEGTGEPSGPVSDIQLAALTDAGATEPADTADVAVDPGNVTDLEPASDVEAEVPDSGEDAGETTEEQDEGGEEPDLWTNTCPTPPKGLVDFHGDEFDALLERLWNDFWDPSGNWEEDMMGDAT